MNIATSNRGAVVEVKWLARSALDLKDTGSNPAIANRLQRTCNSKSIHSRHIRKKNKKWSENYAMLIY